MGSLLLSAPASRPSLAAAAADWRGLSLEAAKAAAAASERPRWIYCTMFVQLGPCHKPVV